MKHEKRQQHKQYKRHYDLLISAWILKVLFWLALPWSFLLVAPVDQLSPGAALVVPHHLTIVLLVKILIIIIDLVKAKSEASAYILKIKAIIIRRKFFFLFIGRKPTT